MFSHNHQAVQGDICLQGQQELISDILCRVKFLLHLRRAKSAESVSYKPFSPERKETDNNPDGIEARRGICSQRKCINNEQEARSNVQALIQNRIAFRPFCRDKSIRKEIKNRAYPAECVNEKFWIHKICLRRNEN